MTLFRLISLPIHGAIELLVGTALMVAPFALGFTAAGTVASITIGALAVGFALAAASVDPSGRGMSIGAHYSFDWGVIVALLGGALLLAVSGDRAAATTFAAAFAVQLALATTTRYSERG